MIKYDDEQRPINTTSVGIDSKGRLSVRLTTDLRDQVLTKLERWIEHDRVRPHYEHERAAAEWIDLGGEGG